MRAAWLLVALLASAGCLSRDGSSGSTDPSVSDGEGGAGLEPVPRTAPPTARPQPVAGEELVREWNGTVALRGDWIAVCGGPGPPATWTTTALETRSDEVDLDVANVTGIDLTATWTPDDPSASILSINLIPPGGAGPDLRRNFPYRSGPSPLTWRIEGAELERMGDPTQVRALFDRDCDGPGAWMAQSAGIEVSVSMRVEYADGSARELVLPAP